MPTLIFFKGGCLPTLLPPRVGAAVLSVLSSGVVVEDCSRLESDSIPRDSDSVPCDLGATAPYFVF